MTTTQAMRITATATLATTMLVIDTEVSSFSAIPSIADTREIELTVNTMLDTAPGTAQITVMAMMAVAMVTGTEAATVMAVAMVTSRAVATAVAMVMGTTAAKAMGMAMVVGMTVVMGMVSRATTTASFLYAWLTIQWAKQPCAISLSLTLAEDEVRPSWREAWTAVGRQ